MSAFTDEIETPEFDTVVTLAENVIYLLPQRCDDIIVRKTLQETYRDFCRQSTALRTWRRIPLHEGVNTYPVTPVLSSEVNCVTQVLWGDRRGKVHLPWRVMGDPPVLHFMGDRGHAFFLGAPKVELVVEKPNTGSVEMPVEETDERTVQDLAWTILVETVEIPHIGEERAPKAFLNRCGDVIVHGALFRLMSMTGRAWAAPEEAARHGIAYANAINEARWCSGLGGLAASGHEPDAVDREGSFW